MYYAPRRNRQQEEVVEEETDELFAALGLPHHSVQEKLAGSHAVGLGIEVADFAETTLGFGPGMVTIKF